MGEGEFELFKKEYAGELPNVVLITKVFINDKLSSDQFNLETRWLLRAAHCGFTKRNSEVMTGPEAELISEAAGINERWPKRVR